MFPGLLKARNSIWPLSRRLKYSCQTLLITFTIHAASAQDSTWHRIPITSDVAVFMPGRTTTFDTTQVQAINSYLDGYFFQLKYLKPKYQVKNGDELIQAYDGFLSGYFKTPEINQFTNTVYDTSLNGTMGEWIHSRYSKDTVYQDMHTYLVLVNSHFYMLSIATRRPINASDSIFRRYFASLQFPNAPIKEYSGDFPLQAKSYRNGQHIGRFFDTWFPYILGIGIATLSVVFARRRIRRKRTKTAY
jgi:hypothetical protein